MTAAHLSLLADGVLIVHVGVILFNLFGLIIVPIGRWRHWGFVRIFWWRGLHLASMGVVAVQAGLGRFCFLTVWQNDLLRAAGSVPATQPLIQAWVNRVIFWPLPLWFFSLIYGALMVYALWLWRLVPPSRRS